MTYFAFPLEQIGAVLRSMSFSGTVGNAAAILIYVCICLIPALIYYILKKREKLCKADRLLFLLSVLLFFVLYYMINPALLGAMVPESAPLLLGTTFYSVLCGYLVLRLMAVFQKTDGNGLQKGLRILLYLLIVLFAAVIFIECFSTLPEKIKNLQEANTGLASEFGWFSSEPTLTVTYVFLGLQTIIDIIPYVLDILVTFAGIRLLDELLEDQYSDEAVKRAGRLALLCVRTLGITVISGMTFNMLQLLFHKALYQIHTAVVIPLFSIVFVLAALFLARYVQENQKLKQDNDLFI